jgi:monoterpene epsilon-lactone hydrolase
MSIRARMLNMMLKATVRKQFSNLDKIEELRKGGSSSAKLPADLKTEQVDVDGVPAEWVVMPGSADDAVMLYLHGGGFVFGGLDSHRDLAWRLGQASGMRSCLAPWSGLRYAGPGAGLSART